MIRPSPFFNQFVLKSWWVILFFMICCFAYDQGSFHQRKQVLTLTSKLEKLEKQKEILDLQTKELRLQVASQNDPEYIEMVLMRRLGLILEGQKKVLFVPAS
jgi:hypothetical protein